ncbi:MAG: prepilin-type N-terminal cleavage/methylation domain-containing protein [Syntrophaceae bacterium]|nr:prepilin-type N-terminal cleavage/methylation domain-containing protein [Syntrophaceae bacterium]
MSRESDRHLSGTSSISPSSGFTLLELLISLTIVGVVLVIIFGSLRIGARAWEKGEADVEAQQREKVVLSLIKRQISSFCVRKIEHEDQEPYFFRGDESSMSFMSRLPVVPTTRSGMVYVTYIISASDEGGVDLSLYEEDVVTIGSKGVLENPDEEFFDVLLSGAYDLWFEYLKRPDEEGIASEWQAVWDPAVDEGFPMAVRVTYQREEDTMPHYIIAHIYPESERQSKVQQKR